MRVQAAGAPGSSPLVGVVGAGTMGAGIAQVAATAGCTTLLLDARDGAAEAAVAGIADRLAASVRRGRIGEDDRQAVLERLSAVAAVDDLARCDLVVEAVVEDLAAKHALLADLERVCAPTAVLASNTSSLSVDDLAGPLQHPGRVAGLHFFNPAPVMRLVEVVHGRLTDPAVVEGLVGLARAWGKTPVTCTSTPGFVVNRVARPFYGEAFRLLDATDVAPATLDAMLREAGGFPMGPLELTDLIGQDVNAAVNRSVFTATGDDPRYTPSPVQDALVAAGRLGRKSGQGFYDHGAADRPAPATVAPGPTDAVQLLVEADQLAAVLERSGAGPGLAPTGPGAPAVRVRLTDGRTAAQVEAAGGGPVVLVDLVRDPTTCTRVGAVASPGCPEGTLPVLADVLGRAGVALSPLPDTPGLVVARTAAALVAAAEDAVEVGVASAADVDLAMEAGAGHPRGPLAWGAALGRPWVVGVLDALHAAEPSGRYRVPATLRARAMLSLDRVSARLGLELVEAGPGHGVVRGQVTEDWLNGFGIVHGGVISTVADTALAVACNSHGPLTVGAGFDVVWVSPGRLGQTLVATADERARYGRNGVYDITVSRSDGSVVAEARGRTRTVGAAVPRPGEGT